MVVVCFVVASYSLSQGILLDSLSKIEEQHAQQNTEKVMRALSSELSELDSIAYEWARKVETYTFIEGANEDYIHTHHRGHAHR